MIDIKANIQPGKVVTFSHYFKGELWYETEDGTKFPVPITDLGTETVTKSEKALFFIQYMRKWNEALTDGKE